MVPQASRLRGRARFLRGERVKLLESPSISGRAAVDLEHLTGGGRIRVPAGKPGQSWERRFSGVGELDGLLELGSSERGRFAADVLTTTRLGSSVDQLAGSTSPGPWLEQVIALWRSAYRRGHAGEKLSATVERPTPWEIATDVLGMAELSDLLGVVRPTVYKWAERGLLPDPDFTVSTLPAWRKSTLRAWAEQTDRLEGPHKWHAAHRQELAEAF